MAVKVSWRENLLFQARSFKTLLSVDPKIQNRNRDANTKQYRQMNEQGACSVLRDCKCTLASSSTRSSLQDCNISHDNTVKVKITFTKPTICFPSGGFFWVIPAVSAIKKGATSSLTNIDLKRDVGTVLSSLFTIRILYVFQAVKVGLICRCSNIITYLCN